MRPGLEGSQDERERDRDRDRDRDRERARDRETERQRESENSFLTELTRMKAAGRDSFLFVSMTQY